MYNGFENDLREIKRYKRLLIIHFNNYYNN